MSKFNSTYLVPVLALALFVSALPQLGAAVQLNTNPVASWWDDLFGGSSSETEKTSAPPASSYAIYIKFQGIDGESKDDNHDRWIDVLSFDFGMSAPETGTGATRRRGDVIIDDISITKQIDKSTPKLQEKCAKGEVIPKLEVEVTRSIPGANATFNRYELKNVMITSIVSSSTDEERPTDTLTLNFEEIKVTYSEFDDGGSNKGSIEWEFKVEEDEI